METPWKPNKKQLADAIYRTVPDLIAADLDILFCGINPGLYTAAVGHHFARPGNRFWPVLFAAGITPRPYSPFEEKKLLDLKIGITNVVARTTATAAELTREELEAGGKNLVKKINRYRPRILAILGITAYKTAFGKKTITLGEQPEKIAGTRLWILPNPSGLNAHFQIKDMARLFKEVRISARS